MLLFLPFCSSYSWKLSKCSPTKRITQILN
nr:MAG TPA: hypothetical protein [Caudoviricetes sp.]